MADDLSNVCAVGMPPTGESLRELRHLPDRRQSRRSRQSKPAAEDGAVEETLSEDEEIAEPERHLDVNV